MKNKRDIVNMLIIMSLTVVVGLLCYTLFFNKKDNYFNLIDSKIELKIGTKKQLNYSLSDGLNVEWSSNNDIVSVDNDGMITANNYGESIITGTVNDNGTIISKTCIINTYSGDIGVILNDIEIAPGYLLMNINSEYDIPFIINPTDAYITSLEYYIEDENIAIIDDNKIIAKNIGSTKLTILINKLVKEELVIKVSNNVASNRIVKDIDTVELNINDITMEMNDTKEISYRINPSDGYIEKIEWISSDPDVVTIKDGVIKAINIGEATVSVVINDKISSLVNVLVKSSNAEIVIDYNPKTTIRIGEKTNIKAHINPSNVKDLIIYRSSNENILKIDNGIITGVNSGTAVITLSISNGKTKTFTINVLPMKGSFSGTLNLWGYKSLNAKVPILADKLFFLSLAQKGVGVLRNDTYIVSTSDIKFSYDIKSNILTANNKRLKMRIYYPTGKDLSELNTLTYMGGDGEINFGGYFNNIENDPSIIKSAGIVILVAEGSNTSFDQYCGVYATQFVKLITNQKTTVRNSIMGFSNGGTKVMASANMFNYDKVIVFSSYYNWPTSLDSVKNKEVFFYIPSNDHLYNQARTTLSKMKDYKNVIVVSNNNEMAKLFGDNYLVINPGSLMKSGHLSVNVELSGIISYVND